MQTDEASRCQIGASWQQQTDRQAERRRMSCAGAPERVERRARVTRRLAAAARGRSPVGGRALLLERRGRGRDGDACWWRRLVEKRGSGMGGECVVGLVPTYSRHLLITLGSNLRRRILITIHFACRLLVIGRRQTRREDASGWGKKNSDRQALSRIGYARSRRVNVR